MTEHIDFDRHQILMHGEPLWRDNDYMHPANKIDRLRNLMACLPCIRGIIVLGDLPELRNISLMLPGLALYRIPFPFIAEESYAEAKRSNGSGADLIFTGVLTDYRLTVCANMEKQGISVKYSKAFVSRRRRDLLNRSAKLVLNIPQRQGWRWLSAMRIISALRSGRATVSLATRDDSNIAKCCQQIDLAGKDWVNQIKNAVADWRNVYRESLEAYLQMASDFEVRHPFPKELFECWAITDRLRARA